MSALRPNCITVTPGVPTITSIEPGRKFPKTITDNINAASRIQAPRAGPDRTQTSPLTPTTWPHRRSASSKARW